MIFSLEVKLIKAQVLDLSLDSIGVWANLPNTYSPQSDPFENRSLNFFVIFSQLRSTCSVYWIDLSADSLNFL